MSASLNNTKALIDAVNATPGPKPDFVILVGNSSVSVIANNGGTYAFAVEEHDGLHCNRSTKENEITLTPPTMFLPMVIEIIGDPEGKESVGIDVRVCPVCRLHPVVTIRLPEGSTYKTMRVGDSQPKRRQSPFDHFLHAMFSGPGMMRRPESLIDQVTAQNRRRMARMLSEVEGPLGGYPFASLFDDDPEMDGMEVVIISMDMEDGPFGNFPLGIFSRMEEVLAQRQSGIGGRPGSSKDTMSGAGGQTADGSGSDAQT